MPAKYGPWTIMATDSICDRCVNLCIDPTSMDRGSIWYSHFCLADISKIRVNKEKLENDLCESAKHHIDGCRHLPLFTPYVAYNSTRDILRACFLHCQDVRSDSNKCESFVEVNKPHCQPSWLDKFLMSIDFNSCSRRQYDYFLQICRKAIKQAGLAELL